MADDTDVEAVIVKAFNVLVCEFCSNVSVFSVL